MSVLWRRGQNKMADFLQQTTSYLTKGLLFSWCSGYSLTSNIRPVVTEQACGYAHSRPVGRDGKELVMPDCLWLTGAYTGQVRINQINRHNILSSWNPVRIPSCCTFVGSMSFVWLCTWCDKASWLCCQHATLQGTCLMNLIHWECHSGTDVPQCQYY